MGFSVSSNAPSTTLLGLGAKEQPGLTEGQKLFENSLFSLLFVKLLVSDFLLVLLFP